MLKKKKRSKICINLKYLKKNKTRTSISMNNRRAMAMKKWPMRVKRRTHNLELLRFNRSLLATVKSTKVLIRSVARFKGSSGAASAPSDMCI